AGWQQSGAMGSTDVELIKSAHLDPADKEYAIGGLEQAVQTMLDKPWQNNGFALNFDSSTDFNSSKAQSGRPRLEVQVEDAAATPGPDLSVAAIETDPAAPKAGQEVTFKAIVKNVGSSAVKGFGAQWVIGDKPGPITDHSDSLEPGQSATVPLQRRFEGSPSDQRVHPISLRVVPSGSDSCSANNELGITEDATPVDVTIPTDVAQKLAAADNSLGSHSAEDWVQQQVRLWNDTYADQSRFSFAPEGSLVRIRVNSISVGGGAGVKVEDDAAPGTPSLAFLRNLSVAVGVLDGRSMEIAAGKVQVPGSTSRSSTDLYPGLMGDGDTRFDGGIPGALPLNNDPYVDPALAGAFLEPTDLFAATDVAALNTHLGQKVEKPSDVLLPIQKAIILRVLTLSGEAVQNANLLFFQSANGAVSAGDPTFVAQTNNKGIAVINARGSAGPFGDLAPDAGNGVFLIQVKSNGAIDTVWLKAWQLTQAKIRGAITCDLVANVPDAPLDTTVNLATDRSLSDSTNDLPAKLAPLIDDDESTGTDLPGGKSWLEIDLGRDRTIGEIALATNGKPFWQQFDIMVYATGQRPEEAIRWVSEQDWAWTSTNRRDPGKAPSSSLVTYRGPAMRFRYIRIVNRSGGPGSLSEMRITPAKVGSAAQ
ncbi:MAG TPA: hypothetical protein VG944_16075, partial [Fimbriimonas sp.]|nr:hypothetical protein [Fimbriimonas sp.]